MVLLQSELADEGITSIVKNANPPAAGEVAPIAAWPELWVIEDQYYEKAERILKRALKKLEESQVNTTWRCPQCSELIAENFNICWRCGNSRN